jgi:hypothetical protein
MVAGSSRVKSATYSPRWQQKGLRNGGDCSIHIVIFKVKEAS